MVVESRKKRKRWEGKGRQRKEEKRGEKVGDGEIK